MNTHGLKLEQEYGLRSASDPRGGPPFLPLLGSEVSSCPQLPTTLPTFDELLGVGGVTEANIAAALFALSQNAAQGAGESAQSAEAAEGCLQVFTLHAELEGMLLLDAFEALLHQWRESGAQVTRMAKIHERAMQRPLPRRAVVQGEVPGRSGLLAVQAPGATAA